MFRSECLAARAKGCLSLLSRGNLRAGGVQGVAEGIPAERIHRVRWTATRGESRPVKADR